MCEPSARKQRDDKFAQRPFTSQTQGMKLCSSSVSSSEVKAVTSQPSRYSEAPKMMFAFPCVKGRPDAVGEGSGTQQTKKCLRIQGVVRAHLITKSVYVIIMLWTRSPYFS